MKERPAIRSPIKKNAKISPVGAPSETKTV